MGLGSGKEEFSARLAQEAQLLSPAELRTVRRFAVQFVYRLDFTRDLALTDSDFEIFVEQVVVPERSRALLRILLERVIARRAEVDGLIEAHSHNWKLARIGKVDLAILRVCICELLERRDLPFEVIVADAAEIGKETGTSGSGAFVNGVLDGVAKARR